MLNVISIKITFKLIDDENVKSEINLQRNFLVHE